MDKKRLERVGMFEGRLTDTPHFDNPHLEVLNILTFGLFAGFVYEFGNAILEGQDEVTETLEKHQQIDKEKEAAIYETLRRYRERK